jgi:hypothetical protein
MHRRHTNARARAAAAHECNGEESTSEISRSGLRRHTNPNAGKWKEKRCDGTQILGHKNARAHKLQGHTDARVRARVATEHECKAGTTAAAFKCKRGFARATF